MGSIVLVHFHKCGIQVMGLLCGSHGSKGCTEKRLVDHFDNNIIITINTITIINTITTIYIIFARWFDYMGSTDNGYSPFQINYQVLIEN